jgi:hypothetical protein
VTDAEREAQARMQHAAARGVTFSQPPRVVIGNAHRLWPEELQWFKDHRDDVISALTPRPAPQPPHFEPESAPQLWCPFLDRYIEEADVLEMLAGDGDGALAAYRDGLTPKLDAYRAARAWLKQRWQLESRADARRQEEGQMFIDTLFEVPQGTRVIHGTVAPPPEVQERMRHAVGLWPHWDWVPAGQVHTAARCTAASAQLSRMTTSWPPRADPPAPPALRGASAAPDPATHGARVRAALVGPTPRALPASDPPLPAARFSGVHPSEAPPPVRGLAERAQKGAK